MGRLSRSSGLRLTRASMLLIAAEGLERWGAPVEAIVGRAGVTPRWLEAKPDMLIPLQDLYRVLEVAGREIDGFGAHLSDRSSERSGQFGQIVRSGVTLYDALLRFCTYTPTTGTFHTHHLVPDPEHDGVWLARSAPVECEGGVAHSELMVLRFVIETVRLAAGPHWKPDALRLRSVEESRSAIESVPEFQGMPTFTGADWSGICIPTRLLALPMPPVELLRADQLVSDPTDVPSTGFEPALRELLVSCGPLAPDLSLETVAEMLSVHPRSLQRRLQASGTTFRSVVDQARCLRARELVVETDASLAEIAYEVGYSDQSNFTRAFRRWTGSTPGALRLGTEVERDARVA